jgi:6-phosphogluconolactonase (cycloisomerase 2 family)
MRMKFNKTSQLLLVSAASLLVAGLMTACGTATLDFVYVSSSLAAGSNSYGEIDVFEINAVSGFMRQIPASPFPSGGRDPVAMAVASDYSNLYVVNQLDNNIVQFEIGPDGKLYPLNTVNTPGIYPLAVAVNGSNLFVVDTFQPLASCSLADPCSGSVAVFPIEAASGTGSAATPAGALGSPVTNTSNSATYWPLKNPSSPTDVMVPTAISSFGKNVAVPITAGTVTGGVATFTASQSAVAGSFYTLSGFSGAGSALNGQVVTVLSTGLSSTQFEANVTGISSGTTGAGSAGWGEYVFVTAYDSTAVAANNSVSVNICNLNASAYAGAVGYVYGFSVGSSGALTAIPGSPFAAGSLPCGIASDSSGGHVYVTDYIKGQVLGYSVSSGVLTSLGSFPAGNQPKAIAVDPAYSFAYVANSLDGTVSGYSIGSSGALGSVGTPYPAGQQPVAIGIDPSAGHFVFTANFLGSNVSDFEMSTTAGTLVNAQHSPYTSNAQPTAVVAIPNPGGPKK